MEKSQPAGLTHAIEILPGSARFNFCLISGLSRFSCCSKHMELFHCLSLSVDTKNNRNFLSRGGCACSFCAGCSHSGNYTQNGNPPKYLFRTFIKCSRFVSFCICIKKLDDVCFPGPLLPGWYMRPCITILDIRKCSSECAGGIAGFPHEHDECNGNYRAPADDQSLRLFYRQPGTCIISRCSLSFRRDSHGGKQRSSL